jgi:hypothetical protein
MAKMIQEETSPAEFIFADWMQGIFRKPGR